MAGINLSQSLQEKEAQARGSFLDVGLYINLGILLLTLAVFGAGRYYLGTLNSAVADLDAQIATKSNELKGDAVDRVSDLRDRLDFIQESLAATPDPMGFARQIEEAMIPAVRLTAYEEQWEKRQVILMGETENLKYVSQTMLALKKNPAFSKVAVTELGYNEEGLLEFGLVVTRASEEPKSR